MPRNRWSAKDERQYEEIKESAKERGRSDGRAQEIAARTVNRRRRQEGRTANKTTSGTGNPHTLLEDRTRDELYNRARQLGVQGRSQMRKGELIEAIRRRA
jgi:plasmid stabilization system protein ParE